MNFFDYLELIIMRIARIMRIKRDIYILNLSDRYLKELPTRVFTLHYLEELSFANNKLEHLPPEIGQLTNLKRSYIGGNKFKSLPPEIGQLSNLQLLNLHGNDLEQLPPEIGQLTNLKELDLDYNKLKHFPPEIGQLTNLTSLEIQNNTLENLLPEIGQLTNLTSLNLSNNKLDHLPPEIGQLTNLTSLNLSNNKLDHLPPEIGQLTNLTSLEIRNNKLEHLPPEIGQLTNLTSLEIRNNKLEHLPPEMGQLTNLEILRLSDNQLKHLPHEIGQLTNLKKLSFSGYQLGHLPPEIYQLTSLTLLESLYGQLEHLSPEIGQLTNLTLLAFSNNKLKYLPPEIGQISNLQELYLDDNQLEYLPSEIGQISNLQELHLDNNQLEHLPPEIGQISNLQKLHLVNNRIKHLPPEMSQLTNLKELDLEKSSIENIPPEIIKSSNRYEVAPILDYLKRLYPTTQKTTKPIPTQKTSTKPKQPITPPETFTKPLSPEPLTQPLNETKLVIAGEATTGKTSLVKRLKYNTFNEGETTTEGIVIEPWQLQINGSNVKANIWDFGGQELKHATHQFFFTERTLYVLVLNVRQSEIQNRLVYWLKLITSFAPDSPILLVLNKSEESPLFHLDENQLAEEYNIKGFHRTSCATGEGIAELETAIKKAVANMPHVFDKIPTPWLKVKIALEESQNDFISFSEYQKICEVKGITEYTEQRTLIRFLHDLGVILNFSDDLRLGDTSIRNPQWVTKAIYAVIFSTLVAQQKGELHIKQLEEVFVQSKQANPKDYPPNKWSFIIDIMRKFELCFDLQQDKVLIPSLLPDNAPNGLEDYQKDALAFQYHYDILPSSVILRLMVRLHELIDGNLRWNSGVVLSNSEQQTKALVKADKQANKLFVWVIGNKPRRREMFSLINHNLEHIHSSFAGIKVTPMASSPTNPNKTFSYANLLKLEEMGKKEYYDLETDTKINVSEWLSSIASYEQRELHQHFHGPTHLDQRNSNITIEQLILYPQLGQELTELRDAMRKQIPYGQGTEEQCQDLKHAEEAIEGAREKNPSKVKRALKQMGKWGVDIATNILTEVIKKSVGW